MIIRLILKCVERVIANLGHDENVRVFEILLEIYKFFKLHPPESLVVFFFKKFFKFV